MKKNFINKNVLKVISMLLIALTVISSNSTALCAKTVNYHTIFSKKTVNSRLEKIRDYYYNKPKQLTTKSQKVIVDGSTGTMKYYFHKKDLMFAYGKIGGTEYREYYNKNQLIQLLVDKKGKKRKTYVQSYKYDASEYMYGNKADKFDEFDRYLLLENYGRKMLGSVNKSTKKLVKDGFVAITKISGDEITYHTANFFGPDGYFTTLGTKSYSAKLSKNVKITDYSSNPDSGVSRTTKWLKKNLKNYSVGMYVSLDGSGTTVTQISLPYFP